MTITAPPTRQQTLVGSAFLAGAAVCWGLGFYAQRVSIEHTTPLWATALRFVVAAPLALAALLHRRRAGVLIPWRAGAFLGVILYAAFALQTVAMRHTPVARVALITGLYAVFVPLLQPLYGLARPGGMQCFAVCVALLAMVLLCGVVGDTRALTAPPNLGDLFTLIMAVLAAVLVLSVGRLAPQEDAVALNVVQILVMCVCGVVVAHIVDGAPPHSVDGRTLISLVYLAVASTFVAFLLQMLGQRHVSPAAAGVLMMLETPIGVVAAVVILGERMAGYQWFGAVLSVVAVGLAVQAERRTA